MMMMMMMMTAVPLFDILLKSICQNANPGKLANIKGVAALALVRFPDTHFLPNACDHSEQTSMRCVSFIVCMECSIQDGGAQSCSSPEHSKLAYVFCYFGST